MTDSSQISHQAGEECAELLLIKYHSCLQLGEDEGGQGRKIMQREDGR